MAEQRGDQRSELREKARKIDARYTEGQLVAVASGRNQPEAELIANLLLEQGIPSLTKRTRGFDVPDMLAAGPRDVLVASSALAVARDVLLQTEMIDRAAPYRPAPLKLLAGLSAALVAVAVVVLVGTLIVS